jgi:hypothetical protein
VLSEAGVYVNDKIYGGVFEAIDTIDAGLQRAGQKPLIEQFDERGFIYLGDGGVDESRITKVEKGKGGLM